MDLAVVCVLTAVVVDVAAVDEDGVGEEDPDLRVTTVVDDGVGD